GFIIDSTKYQKWMLANGGGKGSQPHKLLYISSIPGAQSPEQEEDKERDKPGNECHNVCVQRGEKSISSMYKILRYKNGCGRRDHNVNPRCLSRREFGT